MNITSALAVDVVWKKVIQMKVVIDIPEDRYADIQRIASVQLERRCPTPEQIIAKGVTINEPRKGKWILVDPDIDKGVQCSECSGWSEYCTDFCPHCGARMDSSNE